MDSGCPLGLRLEAADGGEPVDALDSANSEYVESLLPSHPAGSRGRQAGQKEGKRRRREGGRGREHTHTYLRAFTNAKLVVTSRRVPIRRVAETGIGS